MASKKLKNVGKTRVSDPRRRPLNKRDQAILETIIARPEATPTQVGQQTGIPADSVRRRLAAMRSTGILREVTLVSRYYTGHGVRAMISIDLDSRSLRSKTFRYFDQRSFCAFLRRVLPRRAEFSHLTRSIRVESVSVVLGGRCDLVLFVAGPDADAICEFVTRVLRSLPGVQNTNTGMVFGDDS